MKKMMLSAVAFLLIAGVLAGCTATEIQMQEQTKIDNAMRVMEQTKVPTIQKSLERENIRQRILVSNDPNTLQWIYPMSAGRVIGRFPVKGKVTSGNKRLTAKDTYIQNQGYTEAPDEMGTYGSSGDYVFWFDPAGRISQHKGDYFVSTVPFKIDLGYGTISTEVDKSEDQKRAEYEKQIADSNAKAQAEAEAAAKQDAEARLAQQQAQNKQGGK